MSVEIEVTSKEYVEVAVASTSAGLNTATVAMAFKTDEGEPSDQDWVAAEWNPIGEVTRKVNGSFVKCQLIRTLVSGPAGGGTAELSKDEYFVWVNISLTPQDIVKLSPTKLVMK